MNNLEIKEVYKDYKPPIDAISVVRTLTTHVPVKYLRGLRHIVLTNSSSLSRDRTRSKTRYRKQKIQLANVCGAYHQEWQNNSAWIEIFVDKIINVWPRVLLRIPLMVDIAFAEVLYHEIGHHIHKAVLPEYAERENVAEKWSIRLTRAYVKKKYWYLLPIFFLLVVLIKISKRTIRLFKRILMKT